MHQIVDNPKCLDEILDFIVDAFFIVNHQGQILKVNQNAVDILKYSKKELLKMKLEELEVEHQVLKDFDIPATEESYSVECKLKTATGQIKHFEITVTEVDKLEEEVFLIFAHNITQYKEKEIELKQTCRENKDFVDELRKQKNRINTILQTSMDAFWIMDIEGYILETNEAFRNMFGYSLMEIMNLNININDLDVTRDKVSILEKLQGIRYEGKDRFETKYKCKNGNMKDLEISVTYVETLDEPIFEVFARDISERKKKEKALQRTQKQLVQSEKMAALGRLVAGIAHEINTPIGVGITAASHIADETKSIIDLYNDNNMKREDLENYLKTILDTSDMILKNLDNASELISNFKQVAVDRTDNKKRKFKLKEYLKDVLVSLKPKLKNTKHKVKINGADDLEVDTYPGAISQIITNLTVNSLRHAFEKQEQGVIKIDILEKDKVVELRYSDNGRGMAEEEKEKIFDPFYTTKRGQGGTGLGLNLVYNLVTSTLNGKIECDSKLGEGTTFTILFPKEGN
ncbi:PAS domain-containing sensor histidine kinase [Halanaerobacter jeridensis]|uniref:PAS domain-containing sensor histidine kinase n=1 Tax=Halanaerobacter jeridensis TaxID=706427 RepID=UPI0019596603|nr:PAS domain-containing sensor histidine kinase [Halanaerobacter jeridensis]